MTHDDLLDMDLPPEVQTMAEEWQRLLDHPRPGSRAKADRLAKRLARLVEQHLNGGAQ